MRNGESSNGEAALLRAAQTGDRTAMDGLLRRHMREILRWIPRNLAVSGDAKTAAMLGFMRAVERYDPQNSAGASLDSYASWWIRGELKKLQACEARHYASHVELSSEDAHVPADQHDELARRELAARILARVPKRERTVLRECVGNERTLEEVGQVLGYTKERVRQIREAALHMARRQANSLAGATVVVA